MTLVRILTVIGGRADPSILSILYRYFLFRTFRARLPSIPGAHPLILPFVCSSSSLGLISFHGRVWYNCVAFSWLIIMIFLDALCPTLWHSMGVYLAQGSPGPFARLLFQLHWVSGTNCEKSSCSTPPSKINPSITLSAPTPWGILTLYLLYLISKSHTSLPIGELSPLFLILSLLNSFHNWTITKINRITYCHAHNIAHWAATTSSTSSFLSDMFSLLDFALDSDKDPHW